MGMGTTADRIQRRERRIDDALKESFRPAIRHFSSAAWRREPEKHGQNVAQNIAVDDPGRKPNMGKKPARKKR